MAKKEKEQKAVKPLNTDSRFHYNLHLMKMNQACYWMMLPFFLLFAIFTIVPVVMSLPLGLTNFNLVQFPR